MVNSLQRISDFLKKSGEPLPQATASETQIPINWNILFIDELVIRYINNNSFFVF